MSETIVGSVGVQLVPSAEGFTPKARSLLRDLSVDVALKPVTGAFQAEMAELTRDRTVNIRADADTAAAEAQIAAVARDRTANINATGNMGATAKSSRSTAGFIGAIAGSVAILGPALIPVVAGFAGIAGFAGVAAKAVMDLSEQRKAYDAAIAKAASARTEETYKAAIAEAEAIQASIDGPQKALLSAQAGLGAAFDDLVKKTGPSLFAPLVAGLNLLAMVMPRLEPLIVAVSNALMPLIDDLSAGVASGGFDRFINYLISTLPTVIGFVQSFGGFLKALFEGAAPAGMVLLQVMTGLFNFLAMVPGEILAPLAAGLIGLIGGPIVAAIAAVTIGIATLWASSQRFRDGVMAVGMAVGSYYFFIAGTIGSAVGFILDSFSSVIQGAARVLLALSKVPGMGWAKDVAQDLLRASAAANTLSNSVSNIPTFHEVVVSFRIRQVVDSAVSGAIEGGVKAPAPSTPKLPSLGALPSFGGGGGAKKAKKKDPKEAARKEAKSLLRALVAGIRSGGPGLEEALKGVLSNIKVFPKKFRSVLKATVTSALAQVSKIKEIKKAMTDLAASIKQAFTPGDLFSGSLGKLRGGLARALMNVKQALAAQKALLTAGVAPAFVSALLASGNGLLATQLAANPELAKDFAAQYASLGGFTSQLGNNQAAAQFNPQLKAANDQLAAINKRLGELAPAIGKEINRSVPKKKG